MKALKLSVITAALLSAAAIAQDNVREVTAQEAIVGGDKQKAKELAVKKALREAVEQVAGVLVSGDTLTANATLVSDRVYSRSEGFVKTYKVLEAKEVDNGSVMEVKVRAEVATKDLDKELQVVKGIVARLGNRKLVILLQEQTIMLNGQVVNSGVVSTVLTEGFGKDGWTIVDPAFAAGEVSIAAAVGTGAFSESTVKKIRDISKADYILYGKVGFRHQDGSGPMLGGAKGQSFFPVTGEYEMSVFATDSGSQLTTLAGKLNWDAKTDKFPALSYERTAHELAQSRGKEVLERVRKAVVEYLANSEQNGSRFVFTVMGLTEYAAVQNFKKFLAAHQGVREVRPGSFSNGKAEFDVVFVGSSDEFADRLTKKFGKREVNVTGVSGNTIELTLAK